MKRLRIVVGGLGLTLASVVVACLGSKQRADSTLSRPAGATDPDRVLVVDTVTPGFRFRLAPGAATPAPRESAPYAQGEPLAAERVAALVARMPAIAVEVGDRTDFALRPDRPPPAGPRVTATFPAPSAPAAPPVVTGALEVTRHAPEGEVPLAPHASLTFSQPMVPVSGQAPSDQTPFARLSPQPPGQWRWIGAQTLAFEPRASRLPMATEFTVEVPAGTSAARGAKLARSLRFTFATPAPKVEHFEPQGVPVRREPLLFARFDQRIEPAAVLTTTVVRAGAGGPAVPMRLATAAEVAGDAPTKALCDAAERDGHAGRYLVFRPVSPLPAGSPIEVALGPGTPSAEGPRKSATAERFSFETYGPLRLVRSSCGGDDRPCEPGEMWMIHFSNPLDEARFDPALVRVEPEVPGLSVSASGNYIMIEGQPRGRRSYRVSVGAALSDQFGQTLGQGAHARFDVAAARPRLTSNAQGMVVLDPGAAPSLAVFSVNHPRLRVRAYAVQPQDWQAYQKYAENLRSVPREPQAPGRPLIDAWVDVRGEADALTETAIDLAPALSQGLGHVVVLVDPGTPWSKERPWERQLVCTWVQATRIGLTAFSDQESLVGWASALGDGAPLAGVELSLWPSDVQARTGGDGLATLALGNKVGQLLIARMKHVDGRADVAFLPDAAAQWGAGHWRRAQHSETLVWYVTNDRGMYKPGEQMRVKGWVRRRGLGRGDPLALPAALAGQPSVVAWRARDVSGAELARGETKLSALGGFALTVQLPKTLNLGPAQLELEPRGLGLKDGTSHGFTVQEFRRPEFEVRVNAASEGPHFVGESALLVAHAKYYSGGALPNAEARWQVSATATTFTPPGRSEYTFGIWKPWWWARHDGAIGLSAGPTMHGSKGRGMWPGPRSQGSEPQTLQGHTTPAGEHALSVEFVSANPPEPQSLHAEASVADRNRQQWTGTAELLVHPSALYVGVRSDRYFVQAGQPLEVDAIAVDLDGKAVPGRAITLRAARLQSVQVRGQLEEQEHDAQDCAVVSAADAVRCTFTPKVGGRYRIRATVRDARGRPNLTQLERWVAGETQAEPPQRNVERQTLTLIPSQAEFSPGQTAELLVLAPFFPAEGTLSLRRSGMVRTQRFAVTGPSHTLKLPIDEAFVPNVIAEVHLVGSAERVDDRGRPLGKGVRRPAHASGMLSLPVSTRGLSLALQVSPRDAALAPGGSTVVDVTVRDAKGQPIADAEVALVVVDEAVLALSQHRLPDPIATFHGAREAGVVDMYLRDHLLLAKPPGASQAIGTDQAQEESAQSVSPVSDSATAIVPTSAPVANKARMRASGRMALQGMVGAGAGLGALGGAAMIALRSDFAALALFAPELRSDAQGRIAVEVKLPDNLTRYRVMAIAAQGAQRFGAGESVISARLPLMVRPSPPRFLNFGDRFELPVLLQNQTDQALQVEVAVRAHNAEPGAPWGRRVQVPANDRIELRVPAAAQQPGTARFQVGAIAGAFADAAELSLPVWTPTTREAFATYGVIDDGAIAQPIAAPPNAAPQFGGLSLSTSSTALQGLADAVLYLVQYPYECSEQIASRLLAIASLRDVLGAFKAQGLPPPDKLAASVRTDLERLQQLQNHDGGWGFWQQGSQGWPYLAIHVTHALARAKRKGFTVPDPMLQNAHAHLKQIEAYIPGSYDPAVRRNLQAHALYVRKLLGDRDLKAARALLAQQPEQKTDLETLALLFSVLSADPDSAAARAAISRQFDNRVQQTAAAAHFTSSFGDAGYVVLHSERRVDAIALEALIEERPKSDLIPKLVAGLLGHRKAGRWESTQENAFVLAALDTYFRRYEAATPDMVARAWLGREFAGEQLYRGRSTETQHIDVPMAHLSAHPASQLIVEKRGQGRLYYRIGMQYAPKALVHEPLDAGFAVERTYEAVDSPSDVERLPNGQWKIRAGARVRVRVRMAAPARRYHVALADPLPAGLEALNPALAVTGSLPVDTSSAGNQHREPPWWWSRTWYEHQNLRDERAEAFTSLLWEGVHEYTYYARATTPGSFVAPPAHAEEMYHPETFGRSASTVVQVY